MGCRLGKEGGTLLLMARVVDLSTISLPEQHVDEALTAILSTILFIRYQHRVTCEKRELKEGLSLSYAAIVDSNETAKEISYIITKLRRSLEKGLRIVRLRFLEMQMERQNELMELFTHGVPVHSGASMEVEVWNISVEVICETKARKSSEAVIRAALRQVYDACMVCDQFSVPCVFTLSVVRKGRSGSESDSTSEGSAGQRNRRSERCRPRSSSVSSANGRSLLFKIFNSAGIL